MRSYGGEALLTPTERDLVRQLREAAPHISEVARAADREMDLVKRREAVRPLNAMVFQLGLHTMELTEKRGGLGLPMRAKSVVLEELSRADAGFAIATKATASCAAHLELLNLPSVTQRFLEPYIRDETGHWLLSGATSEPLVGSDAVNFELDTPLGTTATPVDGGFELSGEKWMMTNCATAAGYAIVAQRPGTRGLAGRLIAVVAADAPGLTALPVSKRGLRTAFHGTLILDRVRVPNEQVLVPPASTPEVLRTAAAQSLARVAVDMASMCLGVAQAACDVAHQHLHTRVQGGQLLAHHQAVVLRWSEMTGALAAARALTRESAALADQGALSLAHGAAARAAGAAAARACCATALDLVGSPGLLEEHPLSKLARDAETLAVPFGSRDLLGLLAGVS